MEGGEKKVVKRLRSDLRRPHAIGQPWAPPGGAGREGAGETWRTNDWRRSPEAESGGRRAILGKLAHVSSINVEALSEGAGLPERAARWRRMARMEELDPCLLHLETGQQPYPWPLPGLESTPVGTILEAMAMGGGVLRRPRHGRGRGGGPPATEGPASRASGQEHSCGAGADSRGSGDQGPGPTSFWRPCT